MHDDRLDADVPQVGDVGGEARPASSSLTMALPPYLTTTIWSRKRRSHGSDSMSVAAFALASLGIGVLDVGHEE